MQPQSPTVVLPHSPMSAYVAGVRAATKSIFFYVLLGTYAGIGAVAHDFGFSVGWAMATTLLVWAAPAQVILISTLGAGATPIEAAIAVSVSSVRLLPMVVSLMPLLKGPRTRTWQLLLPAHFTAISMWVESLRLLPSVPREDRIAFCNGIGTGLLGSALGATVIGFYLAAKLPALFTAALLFLTPLSFFISTARNSRLLVDRLALALGLVLAPLLVYLKIDLDLMWTGLIGGTLAYAAHRARQVIRR